MRTLRLLFPVTVFLWLLTLAGACAAQTENILYSFTGTASDGEYPLAGLVFDGMGNLYGTTSQGGDNGGTIFQLVPPANPGARWTKKTIYSFDGSHNNLSYPRSRLAFHNHALYGTTGSGGHCSSSRSGCGAVFELTLTYGHGWEIHDLYNFAGGTDGSSPYAGVVFDAAGNLYGTTRNGGDATATTFGDGTIYELSPPTAPGGEWTETVLYRFSPLAGSPTTEVVMDKSGALYGTLEDSGGGYKPGLVYQLSPPSAAGDAWTWSDIYDFQGGNYDGTYPRGGVALDASGNLYGGTLFGGGCCGAAYKVIPPSGGGTWTERLILKLGSQSNGMNPTGGLAMDSAGNLYGATAAGGDNPACTATSGCGTIYKLTKPPTPGGTWNETQLYSFGGSPDGSSPVGDLLLDSSGNIYGTTNFGGIDDEVCDLNGGCGIVFELTP